MFTHFIVSQISWLTCQLCTFDTKAAFTLGAGARCPEYDSRWALMWTHLFFKCPRQNSGTGKAETLYSGTKVGTDILGTQCLNTAPFCAECEHGLKVFIYYTGKRPDTDVISVVKGSKTHPSHPLSPFTSLSETQNHRKHKQLRIRT